MLIDSHVHVGRFSTINLECDFEDVIELADRMKLDKVFCTHVKSLYYDYREGDAEVFTAMQKYPERIWGYISITSPRHSEDVLQHIRSCIFDRGFHGIKIYAHSKGVGGYEQFLSIADKYMYPIFEMAQEWKTPVLAHSCSNEVDAVCRDFPNLRLMMAHMGATPISGGDWHTAIKVAERHPNLILDTTGSGMDFGMLEEAVKVIGASRVIWGSDIPMIDPWLNIEKVRGSELDKDSKRLILGENIARLVSEGQRTVEQIKQGKAIL